MRLLIVSVVAAAALAGVPAPASAQRMDLGVGFVTQNQSWQLDPSCCARGLGIDFSYNIIQTGSRAVAIVADTQFVKFSDGFGFEETDNLLLGGVRFKFLRDQRVSLFVQGTAGVMRWSDTEQDSGTDLIVGGGGGVQVRLTNRLDVKGQVDLWKDRFEGEWFNITRFFAAVVVRLGGR